MTRQKFEKLVQQAYQDIPAKFREKIDNVVITVKDYPGPHEIEELKLREDSLLLGLYKGTPLPKRSIWQGARVPDEIILFQKDIERVCRSETEIKERVNEVLKHEIAHYFGLSDDEIYALMGRD